MSNLSVIKQFLTCFKRLKIISSGTLKCNLCSITTNEAVDCLFMNTLMEISLHNHVKYLEDLCKKIGGQGEAIYPLFFPTVIHIHLKE